jgi:acetyl-CoA synthetase
MSSESTEVANRPEIKNVNENMDVANEALIPTVVPPIVSTLSTNKVKSLHDYKQQHEASATNPNEFWLKQATEYLSWFTFPYDNTNTKVCQGSFITGDVTWFANAKLNVCYNAIDRHINVGNGDILAMIWEGDETNEIRKITFREMQRTICQICHVLSSYGVSKGSVVTIYMPMSKLIYCLFCYILDKFSLCLGFN